MDETSSEFVVVYDRKASRVTILQKTPRADEWAARHQDKIDALMNGLVRGPLTRPLVEEIQKRLAFLLAENGWPQPVCVGLAPGVVQPPPPPVVAAFARDGLAQLLRDHT